MGKKKTTEEYIEELKIKNPTVEVLETYINANTPILHLCKTHNIRWKISPANALHSHGCDICHKTRIGDTKFKKDEDYKEEFKSVHPHIKLIGKYNGITTNSTHYCELHNVYWDAKPINVLKGLGCKECQKKFKCDKNKEEYKNEIYHKFPFIKIIGDYKDCKTPITHYCEIHNIYWDTTPDNLKHGKGCPKCVKYELSKNKLLTNEEYINKLLKRNPNVIAIEEYKGSHVPIVHHCITHNINWSALPTNVLKGCGCPQCWRDRKREVLLKGHKQYITDVKKVNENIQPIEHYIDSYTPIWHQCNKCGAKFKTIPHNMLIRGRCPVCNLSINEEIIKSWLCNNGITNIPQYRFDDCRDKHPLPFDFYVPDYNLCIEYDGEQHFMPINFSGNGEEFSNRQLKIIQYHDSLKTEYCNKNNINLLRISYQENVEKSLIKFFHLDTVT